MKSDINIAVDVDTGDISQSDILISCRRFLEGSSSSLILCGDSDIINKNIDDWGRLKDQVQVIHANESLTMDMSPSHALRRLKSSSMHHCLRLVKEGKAHAAVSAGNTGALVAIATFSLGYFQSVRRPAICTQLPTRSGPLLMLDLGACVDCKPEDLLVFALLAQELAKAIGYKSQSCALLNVGHEQMKGNSLVKEACKLLERYVADFVGNVEPTQLFSRPADIIVTDGFSGNLVLKSLEATMKYAMSLVKESISKSVLLTLLSPFIKSRFKRTFSHVHPDNYNGAVLLGLRGIVVKSHGMTSVNGFLYAISEAEQLIKHDFLSRTEKVLCQFEQSQVV